MNSDPNYLRLTAAIYEARIDALRGVGFNDADADRWGRAPGNLTVADVVAIAIEYRDHGFEAIDANRWRNHGYPPDVAAWMASRHWTPELSVDLQVRAFLNGIDAASLPHPRGQHLPHTAEDWLRLELTPEITLLYLRTRHTLPEAVELERRRVRGEDIISALRVLDALQSND